MAESLEDGWARGYEQAVAALFDEASAMTPQERAAVRARRTQLELYADYDGVRQALLQMPDTWPMSRSTAQFYLGMSPGVFQKHLRAGAHPFKEPRGGATKAQVEAWLARRMKEKHAGKLPRIEPLRLGRDMETKRVYLVDASGAILADAHVSRLPAEDVAHALAAGGELRIYSFTQALGMPWADIVARRPWAQGRMRLLEGRVAHAKAQDHDATMPHGREERRTRTTL